MADIVPRSRSGRSSWIKLTTFWSTWTRQFKGRRPVLPPPPARLAYTLVVVRYPEAVVRSSLRGLPGGRKLQRDSLAVTIRRLLSRRIDARYAIGVSTRMRACLSSPRSSLVRTE